MLFGAILAAASAGTAVAIAAGGIAAVLAVSAVFYIIGRGEDLDRSQAPPAADATSDPPPPDEPPPGDEPPPACPRDRARLPAGARPRRRG